MRSYGNWPRKAKAHPLALSISRSRSETCAPVSLSRMSMRHKVASLQSGGRRTRRAKESTQPRMGMVHVRSVAIDATREKNRSADHIRYAASLLLCRVGLVSGIEQRLGCVQPAGTRCEEKVAWLPHRPKRTHSRTHTISLSSRPRLASRDLPGMPFLIFHFLLRETLGVARKGKEEAKKGLGRLRFPPPLLPQHFSFPGTGQPERRKGGGFGHRLSLFSSSPINAGTAPTLLGRGLLHW